MRINKKRVETYLRCAIEILRKEFPDGKYPKEFRGYVSSFGVSLVQGHWQAAVAFYSQTGGAQSERKKIPELILSMMKLTYPAIQERTLFDYALNYPENKQTVLEHLVALKLALNLFEPVMPEKTMGG